MDMDMDIDMDIDLGVDTDTLTIEAEAMHTEPTTTTNEATTFEPLDIGDLAPTKVHIRGLDNLSTNDVRAFVSEHYFGAEPLRIEWIDDTSANILYELPEHALKALTNFVEGTITGATSSTQLQRAKQLSTHPRSQLLVRQAFLSDVKKPHARDASRFYLLNPDKDPRERKPQYDARRGRRGTDRRGGGEDRSYRRETEQVEETPFDVNMYDDDAGALAARQPTKSLSQRPQSRRMSGDEEQVRTSQSSTARKSGDLFSERLGAGGDGRLRNRSASPSRLDDGDGRLGFGDGESKKGRMRKRSRTPLSRNSRMATKQNAGKELLASPGILKAKELFPGRASLAVELTGPKELFPRKQSTGSHRRSAAFDAADGTGDLFAHRLNGGSKPRALSDRSNGGSARNHFEVEDDNDALEGFNIRGTASQNSGGFLIRGGAKSSTPQSAAKELFPKKAQGNDGKELFGSKPNGRSTLRA